ncbi:hypothetical protein KS4_04610 [Poriferisphaera corsica]|uniref:Uncharacterized protein n=1 Tax=Poriferisphaera corsica TaxID=2528020 RepID=A0A517YQC9_9BACT|nr:hypothetical protein [Poriferisphaera corsica]QDU32429.1 hypothetical protein KS4_04610 [Poriferisphaera corsica]
MDNLAKYNRMMRRLSASMLSKYDDTQQSNTDNPSVGIGAAAGRILVSDTINLDDIPALLDGLDILAHAAEESHLYGKCARFDDTLGFTRPCYHPMLLHLHLAALTIAQPHLSPDQLERANQLTRQAASAFTWLAGFVVNNKPIPVLEIEQVIMATACLNWFRDLPASQIFGNNLGQFQNNPAADIIDILISRVLSHMGHDGELRPFDHDSGDLLDAWWYRELVALHGLIALAIKQQRIDWLDAAKRIAAHHLANTQPDHTTAQPWGVACYASQIDFNSFADQQLHDCEANWHLTRGGSGVVAALVLADASFTANAMLA